MSPRKKPAQARRRPSRPGVQPTASPPPAAPRAPPADLLHAPPAASEPPSSYEEPGALNPDRNRVEGMSIDPKLEESSGSPTRSRRE